MMDAFIDFLVQYGAFGMFVAAFLAGSVIPFPSELCFTALLAAGSDVVWLLLSAITGNTIGSMTCYWLGTIGRMDLLIKYFGIKEEKIDKTQKWIDRFGIYLAFFSFVPLVGNLIMVSLGLSRTNALKTFLLVLIGKIARYIVWYSLSVYAIDKL